MLLLWKVDLVISIDNIEKEMPVEDRNQIIDVATEYLNRHGDELPLLEAYILLVIPAYQGSILILIYYS